VFFHYICFSLFFFFSSRRRHTRWPRDWSSDVCSSDLKVNHDLGTHYFPWIAAGSTGRVDFIWLSTPNLNPSDTARSPWTVTFARSEERRVGKECRSRWWREY